MLPSLYVAACMPPYVETRIVDEDVEAIDFDTDADLIGISFMTYNAPRAYEIADRFHSEPITLAGLPILDRALIRQQDYAPVDALQATRGCHYQCSFCSVAAFHQYQFRARPVAEVIDELETLGPHVLFMDDNLIGDRAYARELFSAMIPLGKRWFSQCGIGIACNEELLGLASRSGCRGLFVGFESLSQQGLRSWKERGNLGKDYLATVRKLHAAGIAVFAGFVLGGDDDMPDVFERTLAFLLEANVEAVQATRLTPFPGTPLFEALDRQRCIVDRDWSHYDFNHVVFEPLHMCRETLDAGAAWVMGQFYARRRIARRIWTRRSSCAAMIQSNRQDAKMPRRQNVGLYQDQA